MSYKILNNCVCCNNINLLPILDLDNQPLANSYTHDNVSQRKYPLSLNLCTDCFHCQLSIAVDPKLMFTDYKYVSGTTDTLKKYFRWFANYVVTDNSNIYNILDIGSNDGSQLDEFKKHKVPMTVGVEPSENLYKMSKGKGHYIENQYFNKDFKFTNVFGTADKDILFSCIVAQNVFAHNSNPLEFLLKCEQYLHPQGTLYIQVSQANMIRNNEFDTIYHEHISFFNINSINTLLDRTKTLILTDVIETPIHGNSYIFVIKKQPVNAYRIDNLINLEQHAGLHHIDRYFKYAQNVKSICNDVRSIYSKLKLEYPYIKFIGYGAAAKGMVALNYFKIPIDYIIDDNPLKQGLYPPTNWCKSPIQSIDVLLQEDPDIKIIFIPLAWNFFDEIKERIHKVRKNKNDQFLKYFPEICLI